MINVSLYNACNKITQKCIFIFMSMIYCAIWRFGVVLSSSGEVLVFNSVQYVYVRERRDLDMGGRRIWVVLAKSSSASQCPEKRGVIRVKDYKQSLAIENDGSDGTKGDGTLHNTSLLSNIVINTNFKSQQDRYFSV